MKCKNKMARVACSNLLMLALLAIGPSALLVQRANCQTVDAVSPAVASEEAEHFLLVGTLICESAIEFDKTQLKASYVHFASQLLNPAKTSQSRAGEELPDTIPVSEIGEFRLSRVRQAMMFYCESADGKLAGAAQLDEKTDEIKITLQPTASLRGRLVDLESNQPLPGQRIAAELHYANPPHRTLEGGLFGKGVDTDSNGEFEFSGLIAGQNYDLLQFSIQKTEAWNTISTIPLGSHLIDQTETVLGTVDASRSHFDHETPPLEQMAQSLELASLNQQFVLVVFGVPGNKGYPEFLRWSTKNEEAEKVTSNYTIVAIDCSLKSFESARPLAEKLGLKIKPNDRKTHFCVVSAQGEKLASVEVDEVEPSFPGTTMLKILRDHSPVFADASQMLNEALKQARTDGKLVLLVETGVHCGPCVRMSRFLDSTRHLWDA